MISGLRVWVYGIDNINRIKVVNKEDKINKQAETANRRLNLQMVVQYPTLWVFISSLRKVQSRRDKFYNQMETG